MQNPEDKSKAAALENAEFPGTGTKRYCSYESSVWGRGVMQTQLLTAKPAPRCLQHPYHPLSQRPKYFSLHLLFFFFSVFVLVTLQGTGANSFWLLFDCPWKFPYSAPSWEPPWVLLPDGSRAFLGFRPPCKAAWPGWRWTSASD